MATNVEVKIIAEKFDALTSVDISSVLGCDSAYVRATARRMGKDLPKVTRDFTDIVMRGEQIEKAFEFVKNGGLSEAVKEANK